MTVPGTPGKAAALLAALVLPLAACTGGASGDDGRTELTVLAASSLTDVFEQAGAAYEQEHPDTRVTFSFAGSQELAAQVRQGVPADALATADTETMAGLDEVAGEPAVIAENRLTIVTEKGNPERIGGLADLARPGLQVVLAADGVPAGGYSHRILDAAGVSVSPVSEEAGVRSVLSKVELGEADAGIVYVTDARASSEVDTVEIPDAQNAVASYPAAPLAGGKPAAADFVEWLDGDAAQELLRDAGFRTP